MAANMQKLLSFNTNNFSFELPAVFASVTRAVYARAQAMGAHATSINGLIMRRTTMLRRFFAFGTLAPAGLWAALALHEVAVRAPRDAARAIEPVRMTIEDHWRRATGILTAALASFRRIQDLQAAAARQLDSADYALTQLLNDLRPAMALPTDVSGLRAVLAEAERTAPERHRKALAAAA